MFWRISARCASAASAFVLGSLVLVAQGVGEWTTYHGDYTGQRHSRLTQITTENVHQITLAWAFATGEGQIKATPIVSNGIVYVTAPDHVWAIDARSAHRIW